MAAEIGALTRRVCALREALTRSMCDDAGHRGLRFAFDAEEYLSKEELRVASYRDTVGEEMVLRRAKAFARICREWLTDLRPGELIAGSQRGNIWQRGSSSVTSPEQDARSAAIDQARGELGIHFGEGHMVCDYARILAEGLCAQVARIDGLMASSDRESSALFEWQAMKITCEAARDFALNHARHTRDCAQLETDPARRAELLTIANTCERVPWQPARTFREAVQSFWFLHLLLHVESPSVAVSPGRLDQYLYPYYRDDLAAGRITREEARELLACLWLKFWEGDESQNVTIGGVDADGRDVTNELTLWMIELTGDLEAFQPSVSVRVHQGSPQEYLESAARLARKGLGQPSFFNDPVVRAGLESIGVAAGESWDWAIVGCYEAVVAGAEWGRTVAGGASLPECVLRAFETRPESFDALLGLTRTELVRDIEQVVSRANDHERFEAQWAPSPFQSVLMRDCIGSGRDIYAGGAQYNFSACWPGCMATAVDSLQAARTLVYQDRSVSVEQLLAALKDDFAGSEDLRALLVHGAPKFGNDSAEVDTLAAELCAFFCAETAKHRNARGGRIKPSLAMYQQHYRGRDVGATPDGRRAGANFSVGVGPTPGCNEVGITATLASCAKLPHHLAPNGNFLTVSLSPEHVAGEQGLERLLQLIRTYFEQGGSHVMLNVVDAATLRDAQANPERHRDLMVRISGLSAYFVTLPTHIQDDLIERTAQGL